MSDEQLARLTYMKSQIGEIVYGVDYVIWDGLVYVKSKFKVDGHIGYFVIERDGRVNECQSDKFNKKVGK